MPRDNIDYAAPSNPVLCPICGQVLQMATDRGLAAFECERCGQFSDFSDVSASRADGRLLKVSRAS